MTRALRLENFTPAGAELAAEPPLPTAPEAPDAALAAFDEGYRNGWEDCARAEAEAHRKIGADLAAALQDVVLTYAEAQQDVLTALGPLFEDIAGQLLPRLAAEAVAPAVIAELRAAAAEATAGRPVLIAAPAALASLERLIEADGALDVDLRAEPAFAAGQVSIRHAGQRRDIDLGDAAARMADAIRSFVAQGGADAAPASVPIPAPAHKGVA
jgi:flagellar assembly protein FliH